MVNNNFFEMSQIIFNGKEIYYKKGDPCTVPFEFMEFWPIIKNKDFKHRTLLFIHNHPDNYGCNASALDETCMKALYTGLGRPIHFYIFCKVENKIKINHYVYDGFLYLTSNLRLPFVIKLLLKVDYKLIQYYFYNRYNKLVKENA